MKKAFSLGLLIAAMTLIAFPSCKKDKKVTGIKLSETTKSIVVGGEFVLTATVEPTDAANRDVAWSSDKPEVATVDGGLVKGIAEGEATIRVTTKDGGKTAECKITVAGGGANTEINGVKFEFVEIPEGNFTMGSPDNEPGRKQDESPQHNVSISSFYMGKYEVMQAQWKAVMGQSPNCYFEGDSLPIEEVSWVDVQTFIKKLNELTGKEYRLPTEAEWEYACRAGTTTAFNTGNSITTDQANYRDDDGKFREETTNVGTFAPNAWGLYDMHGNVSEWCNDWYDENYYKNSPAKNPMGATQGTKRINRGGGWTSFINVQRSAKRMSDNPDDKYCDTGFRLALSKK